MRILLFPGGNQVSDPCALFKFLLPHIKNSSQITRDFLSTASTVHL